MGLFGGKKKSPPIVGLDIGSSCVKAVELKKTKKGFELTGIGLEPLSRSRSPTGNLARFGRHPGSPPLSRFCLQFPR